MPGKIFINYRRDDERAMAARMRDRLVQAFGAANVFMDVDNLMAGQRFDKELEKALASTDIFLSVIGPRWMEIFNQRQSTGERDYVREEIAAALKRGVTVIPVLIERAPVPRADAIPDDIRELVLHQKHDVTHEQFGRDVAALIDAIRFARNGGRERAGTGRRAARAMLAMAGLLAAGVVTYSGAYIAGVPLPLPWLASGEKPPAVKDASTARSKAEPERAKVGPDETLTKLVEQRAAAAKAAEERAAAEAEAKRQLENDAKLKRELEELQRANAEAEEQRRQTLEIQRQREALAAEKKKADEARAEIERLRQRVEDARKLASADPFRACAGLDAKSCVANPDCSYDSAVGNCRPSISAVRREQNSAAKARQRELDNSLILVLSDQSYVNIQLRPDLAPRHVERIQTLVREGFYNGVKFHRVIDGFIAQTGDPSGTGRGGSKYANLPAEFSTEPFARGTVGAARGSDVNSANSQFFICLSDVNCKALNGQYTVVGKVLSGMGALDRLARGEPPANPGSILRADLSR